MDTKKIVKISAVISLLLSVTMVVSYIYHRDKPLGEGYKAASEYGGDFSLRSNKGMVSLFDFKEKVVVIYFGFMSCKNACPVSMTKIRRAFMRLNEQELKNVQGIFVSIDPKRDKLDELAAFTQKYHKNVIGLVGKKDTVNQLVKQYGVIADMSALDGKSITYTVDHSSRFYMIDKEGKILTTLSYSTTPAELVAKIREMLKEKPKA